MGGGVPLSKAPRPHYSCGAEVLPTASGSWLVMCVFTTGVESDGLNAEVKFILKIKNCNQYNWIINKHQEGAAPKTFKSLWKKGGYKMNNIPIQ